MQSPEIWYSFNSAKYTNFYPAFFEPENYWWVKHIENNFPDIESELKLFLNNHSNKLAPYFDNRLYDGAEGWKTEIFKFWGREYSEKIKHIPFLNSILKQIPGVVGFGISVLEPNVEIKEHYGDTDAIIRCHLPIIVPNTLPVCGLSVDTIVRGWEKGKMMLFCDAHKHKAWNYSSSQRVVLIIDVLHHKYVIKENEICKKIHTSMRYYEISNKYRFLQKLPRYFQNMVRSCISNFV